MRVTCSRPIAAQQIEGGVGEDGRGDSIWDTFARLQQSKVQDASNADVVSPKLKRVSY